VVPGRPAYGHRPGFGDHSREDEHPFGDQPSYGGTVPRSRAAASYAPAFSAPERQSDRPKERQSDRPKERQSDRSSAGGPGWDADTWPGARGGTGTASGRHADSGEAEPGPRIGAGSTYRGGTYASSESSNVTGLTPMMGQPTDQHESWLRDLGPSARHSHDEPRP